MGNITKRRYCRLFATDRAKPWLSIKLTFMIGRHSNLAYSHASLYILRIGEFSTKRQPRYLALLSLASCKQIARGKNRAIFLFFFFFFLLPQRNAKRQTPVAGINREKLKVNVDLINGQFHRPDIYRRFSRYSILRDRVCRGEGGGGEKKIDEKSWRNCRRNDSISNQPLCLRFKWIN